MNKVETYNTTTIQVGNVTVTIHRPVLTEQERLKREKVVIEALQRFGRATTKTN